MDDYGFVRLLLHIIGQQLILSGMATCTLSITIPPELRDRLDAVAADARVSRSWLITTALAGWVQSLDAAVDSGVTLTVAANTLIAQSLELAR